MKRILKRIFTPFSILAMVIGVGISFKTTDDYSKVIAADGDVIVTWKDNVTGYTSGYKSQTASIGSINWLMTMGQNGYFGANSATNHNLSKFTGDSLNAAKAVSSTWTSSTTGMYGIIPQSPINNVKGIEFSYTADDGNSKNTEVYLAFSTSLSSPYELVTLSAGVQGNKPGSTKKVTFAFPTISSSYYAVLFKTGSAARFTASQIKFIEGVSTTGTISFTNSSEQVNLNNELTLTPTLTGVGTLTATITHETIASVEVVGANSIKVNGLKVGTTTLNAEYGGAKASVQIEVLATGGISFTNSSERIRLSSNLRLTPNLTGLGTLVASASDNSITSVSVADNQITVTGLKVGTTTLNAEYGGAKASVEISVYDAILTLSKESLKLLPGDLTTITASPSDFDPTSFAWSKNDPSGLVTLQNVTTPTVTIQAGSIEGQVSLSVEATDGVITRSASLMVLIQETAEGTYSITSGATAYQSPMDPNSLIIDKSNLDLSELAFININNVRLFGSPKTADIMFGGSTTGGSFKIDLADGLFATEIQLVNNTKDSNASSSATLTVNNTTLQFDSISTAPLTFKTYSKSITIATSARLWVNKIVIVAKNVTNAALDFGQYFLDTTAAECASLDVLSTTWDNLKTVFDGADDLVKAEILAGVANVEGNVLEQAIARYNFIQTKYNLTDFLVGVSNPKANHRDNLRSNILSPMTLVLTFMSLLSVAGFYLIRKKSNN